MPLTDTRPYTELIPACFGSADHEFALHDLDAQRARNMVACAILSEVTISDVETELTNYMNTNGRTAQHIQKQVDRFRSMFVI